MHVDDPAAEAGDEVGPEQLHEPSQHHEVDRPLLKPASQRGVARRAVGVGGDRGLRVHAGAARALEAARARPAGRHAHDLHAVAPVDGVEDRLEVGALPGDQDSNAEGHLMTG